MKTIDLTTPTKALNYLKSLPADTAIEIIDGREAVTNPETDAVSAVTGETAYNWALVHRRWHWTAGELVAQIEAENIPDNT